MRVDLSFILLTNTTINNRGNPNCLLGDLFVPLQIPVILKNIKKAQNSQQIRIALSLLFVFFVQQCRTVRAA